MSSSLRTGATAKEALRIRQTECPKSPTQKHEWEKQGLWPSTWHTCKHCTATTYDK